MALTPQEVLKEIKAGKLRPFYFLQGEEPYFIDAITKAIEDVALPPEAKGFNQMVLYGKETNMGAVIGSARRYPMMAERTVVIVKEAQELADLNKAEGQKILESYAQNPLSSTILVFAHKHKVLDGRKTMGKLFEKLGYVVNCSRIPDYKLQDLHDWIETFASEHKTKITKEAVRLLAGHIGNNLSNLANEILKITINLKPGDSINEGMVHTYVGISREYNIFELQKAFLEGNALKAYTILDYFDSNPKDNPLLPNIGALSNWTQKILLMHYNQGAQESEAASVLGVRPFQLGEYRNATRKFSFPKTIGLIHQIKIADLRAKGIDRGNESESSILRDLAFHFLN